ncbi:MFS transporter [Micromonospora sp. NPDC047707]|uniref:MFS transporter n=1 Tax=unclassified Micromonospora TaxID=2617518 RepID=UPI0012B4855A|nr:MFS transporter [Micromonospora sp. WMMC415]QGN48055.1 MFS transporter [Micromonospora sp. WMMC415]
MSSAVPAVPPAVSPAPPAAADVPADPAASRRVAAASLIGTTIEYYDFAVYSILASIVLGPLFFPSASSTASTMAAFATFAVAFVARPIGSILFSTIGDRVGRRRSLLICLLMMGGATVAIGLLPTYAGVGVLAPVLLVVLRILQGLALGGEWGGAVLLATEHAPPGRRAIFGSVPQIGPPLGFVLASLVVAAVTGVMDRAQFVAWGWRIPFLISVVMVAVGLWVRFKVAESPVFEQAAQNRQLVRFPVVTVLREFPGRFAIGVAAPVGGLATWYLITAFSVSYGSSAQGIPQAQMILVACATAFTHMVLVPPAALIAERFGRRIPMLIGAAGVAICVVPAFALLETGNALLVGVGFCVTMIPFTLIFALVGAWLAEFFPTRVRYSGASGAFVLAGVLGGGFAPLIGTALLAGGGSPIRLGLYAGALSLISTAALAFAPETRHRALTSTH